MKQKICFFDLLPVELIHTLFTYFLAHEILFSFSDVSDYLDTVLLTYSSYQLNFKSIRKSYFDLICCQIKPNQVISLTLSDDDDTPGQSELFLSRFRLQQFTHLQSLSLYNVETDALELIFTDLNKLDQLRSFSFHTKKTRSKHTDWFHDDLDIVSELYTLRSEVYVQVLPQLNRLSVGDIDVLKFTLCKHLYYLNIMETTINELQTIFIQTPDLKSLNVGISGDISNIRNLHPPFQLNRLMLSINHPQVSIKQMEEFLPNLPSLTHLTLQAECSIDMVNGYRWEKLCHHLITFHFKFTVIIQDIEQTLETFRTPFWLEEKRWYVAYDHGHLFSVPRFAPTSAIIGYNPQHLTAPSKRFLYQNITKLIASYRHDFNHIEHWKLQNNFFHASSLLFSSDGRRSYNQSLNETEILLFYLHKFPHCHTLSISKDLTLDFLGRLSGHRFEQIRTLDIYSSTIITRYMIEELLFIFPHVEHLRIASVGSKRDMIRLIDGFKYLSNASINMESSFNENEREWFYRPKLVLGRIRRLEDDAYTCRYQRSDISNSSFSIHTWVNSDMQKGFWNRHWPLEYYYFWYRVMRLIGPHPDADWIYIMSVANCLVSFLIGPMALIIKPGSGYTIFGIWIFTLLVSYIISNIIVSHSYLLRKHKYIFWLLCVSHKVIYAAVKSGFGWLLYLARKLILSP